MRTPTIPAIVHPILMVDADDDDDMPEQFRGWAAILRADLHLVAIDTAASNFGIMSSNDEPAKHKGYDDEGAARPNYQGVRASFCKLDWDRYKRDPPSLPMFKFLVSRYCHNNMNIVPCYDVTMLSLFFHRIL